MVFNHAVRVSANPSGINCRMTYPLLRSVTDQQFTAASGLKLASPTSKPSPPGPAVLCAISPTPASKFHRPTSCAGSMIVVVAGSVIGVVLVLVLVLVVAAVTDVDNVAVVDIVGAGVGVVSLILVDLCETVDKIVEFIVVGIVMDDAIATVVVAVVAVVADVEVLDGNGAAVVVDSAVVAWVIMMVVELLVVIQDGNSAASSAIAVSSIASLYSRTSSISPSKKEVDVALPPMLSVSNVVANGSTKIPESTGAPSTYRITTPFMLRVTAT